MDLAHVIVIALLVIFGLALLAGFVAMARLLKKDEAIDAATFLALRQLDEYVTRTKQPSNPPS
jgi:type II secretory pathway pseudopilin PulG